MVTIKANFKPRRSARRIGRLNRLLMVVLGGAMVFTLISFGMVVQVKSMIQSEQSQAKAMAEVNNNLWIEQHRATSFENMMKSREAFSNLSEPQTVLTIARVPESRVLFRGQPQVVEYPTAFGY